MPTTFVKGDLFEESAKTVALAFGADCNGTTSSGVAVAFAKRWPALAEAYAARCANNKMQTGDVFPWKADDGKTIYVLGVHRDGAKAKLQAFERAVASMLARCAADGITSVRLSRVHAGMDKLRVKRVLDDAGEASPIALVVYEQFVRTGGAPSAKAEDPQT